jgi:putative transposase
MSTKIKTERATHQLWAEFRFGVVGGLLASPPPSGELRDRLKELSEKSWRHPIHGEEHRFSLPTIERWYYQCLKHGKDPVGSLRRKLRSDSGTTRHLTPEMKNWLQTNYRAHGSWSGQLHFDNLKIWLENHPQCGMAPSYPTLIRYMRLRGWDRKERVRSPHAPGRAAAQRRLDEREVRSYEVEFVGGLFHLDFHHGSRQIRTARGEWATPLALAVIDDHSRLCCHIQWYWQETTHCLVHGFSQAILKRGVPRSTMLDNGSAMISAEFKEGCSRLGVTLEPTLAYSPYQNGKQESFWGTLEGRLMAMIESRHELSIEELNAVTQAWVEREYNRLVHSETGKTPIERFLNGKSVLRDAPDPNTVLLSFRRDETRSQRRDDGTISIQGKRFEIPNAYRTLRRVTVRFAEWDLRNVHLVDSRTQACLAPIYPLDRRKNAEGLRRRIGSPDQETAVPDSPPTDPLAWPPLLEKILAEHAASGLPPAYLSSPAHPKEPTGDVIASENEKGPRS